MTVIDAGELGVETRAALDRLEERLYLLAPEKRRVVTFLAERGVAPQLVHALAE
jgi:hypothetical protein